MKVASIIAGAAVGAVLVVAATILPLRGPEFSIFSVSQVARMLQIHAGTLGALFVIAFGILVFVICFIAVHTDLARVRARLSKPTGYGGSRRRADIIRSAFAGTSIETVASRLNDGLEDTDDGPDWGFYWPRIVRSEVWRALIRRLVGLEVVTILFYAFYAAAIAQFGPSPASLDISAPPWPNLAAALAILACGGWLWIDDTIDGVIAEMGPFTHRQRRGRLLDASEDAESAAARDEAVADVRSAIAEQGDRTRVAQEAMFERLAALLSANKDEILAANGSKIEDAGADTELKRVLRSISEISLRMLSQITRFTAEQEKVQAALQRRDAEAADFARRWSEFSVKLAAIERTLRSSDQAAPDGPAVIALPRDGIDVASGHAIAANLEAILADLGSLAATDPKPS